MYPQIFMGLKSALSYFLKTKAQLLKDYSILNQFLALNIKNILISVYQY